MPNPTNLVVHGDDTLRIEWSFEACVMLKGVVYNAFTSDSALAKVTWPDGKTVVVALPPGARWVYPGYIKKVVAAAAEARKDGLLTVAL